jgi:nucleotide-binding universal stress UspA family protein
VNVVVGYDGSPAADLALRRAAAMAGEAGRVTVVTAHPSLDSPGVDAEPLLDAPEGGERDALLRRSRDTLREHGIDPVLVARDGDPAEALIQTARDEGAELIVLGNRGSSYVSRALLGSTAENVVRHAPCDVLVVR